MCKFEGKGQGGGGVEAAASGWVLLLVEKGLCVL